MSSQDYFFETTEKFLSEKLAKEASSYCDSLIQSNNHVWSTNFGWSDIGYNDVVNERYENLILVHTIKHSNPNLEQKIYDEIKTKYPTWELEQPDAIQYFVWTGNSRIEWHKDIRTNNSVVERNRALTIYLNRSWQLEWGGEFLYFDQNNTVKRVTPDYNLAVGISGNVKHRTTRIEGRHFRKCLQIFMKNQ